MQNSCVQNWKLSAVATGQFKSVERALHRPVPRKIWDPLKVASEDRSMPQRSRQHRRLKTDGRVFVSE